MKSLPYFQAANLSDSEVIDQFVVRKKELGLLLSEIRNDDMKGSIQHYILIGQRGSGKSTMLRRIEAEINTNTKLKKRLIAVNLSEEQAGIYRLHDLWDRVCDELRVKGMNVKEVKWEEYEDNLSAYAKALYETIQQALLSSKKKLVLLLDNIDRILENIKTDDNHLFRELLSNHKDMRIIGGSTRLSEHHWKYGEPFYQFFQIMRLGPLSESEMKELLLFWAEFKNEPELKKFVIHYAGKLNAVRILSDGMPRTMLSLVDLLVNKPEEHGYEYLRQIIDRATPIYQERLTTLSPLQQKVVLELSFFWDAAKVKELSITARMESKNMSSVLNQLVELQIVEKRQGTNKNMLYLLKERFFNLWLIMTQGGPKQKSRVKWLTVFLELWYETGELKKIYNRFSTDLKDGKLTADHAIIMTKAFVHSKALNTQERDDLLEDTEKLIGNNSEYAALLPKKAREVFNEVMNLADNDRCNEALDKLDEIEQEDGLKNAIRAYIYHIKKDYEKAEKYNLKAIKEGNAIAVFNLAVLYENLNRKEEAEQYYIKAIDKGNTDALNNLAVLYKDLKRIEEAEQYYLKAIDKGNTDALNNLANLYKNSNRKVEAEQYYFKAIKNGNINALYNLANLYKDLNREEEAEKYYLKAIENDNIDALNNLASLYKDLNRKNESEKYYLEAIDKGHIDSLNNLAILYKDLNRAEEAEEYYLKAIDKGYNDALHNLANLYKNLNRKEEAEKYYLKAIEKDISVSLYSLANLYNDLDRIEEAEQYYLKALDKGDNYVLLDLAILHYSSNKLQETLTYIKRFKDADLQLPIHQLFGTIINVWAGNPEILEKSEKPLIEAINAKEIEVLDAYLSDLLVHYQSNAVWSYFQNPQYGEILRDMLKPIYFAAARFIKNENTQDVILTQPPELNEPVEQIIKYIEARREFYYLSKKQ